MTKRLLPTLLLCVLGSGVAHAKLSLEWDGPVSCPRPLLFDAEGDGRAEVLVREKDTTWTVTVLFFEPTAGLRRVEAGSCDEAVHAALLLLQLGSQSTAPALAPPPPPPTTQTEPARVVVPAAFSSAAPWRFSLAGGLALDFGSLSAAEPRPVVTTSASRGLLRAALDVRLGFPSQLSPGVKVQRLVEAQLAGCLEARLGTLSGGPCLALAAGSWQVDTSARSGSTWVLSTSAQLRAAVALVAGFELGAVAGLRFQLRRPAPFSEAGTLFTTPLVASELQLTAGWRW